jgi:hypothetical protein
MISRKIENKIYYLLLINVDTMGTNYYIDQEGDNIESFEHIGKTSYMFPHGKTFIFYRSREYQLSRLMNMSQYDFVIDECGQRITVEEFYNQISELEYIEQDFEFF